MKKIFFSVVLVAFVLTSCKQNPNEKTNNRPSHMNHNYMNDDNMMRDNDSTRMHEKSNTIENHGDVYACPMHSEVKGKKGEFCSKCGMELTEKMTNKEMENAIYACPMHPEVQGKLNSKCSKCGMPLTKLVAK